MFNFIKYILAGKIKVVVEYSARQREIIVKKLIIIRGRPGAGN
jgi:hypothetical protein